MCCKEKSGVWEASLLYQNITLTITPLSVKMFISYFELLFENSGASLTHSCMHRLVSRARLGVLGINKLPATEQKLLKQARDYG
jgi:hypothetical protein